MDQGKTETKQTAQVVTESEQPLEVAELTAAVLRYADEKKAVDPVVLDLQGLVDYTDRFIIVSAGNERQCKAIHDSIYGGLKKDFKVVPRHVEGLPEARWVLIDYVDVVVHIFVPESREFYRLEQLWGEAPVIEVAIGSQKEL